MKVEVAVLGSYGFCGRKATLQSLQLWSVLDAAAAGKTDCSGTTVKLYHLEDLSDLLLRRVKD